MEKIAVERSQRQSVLTLVGEMLNLEGLDQREDIFQPNSASEYPRLSSAGRGRTLLTESRIV